MSETVHLELAEGVVTIRIDRPRRLNALDLPTIRAFGEVVERLEREPVPRVVIASTGSRAFVAGGDLKAFAKLVERSDVAEMSRTMSETLHRLERLPALVVAAVDGDAYGGGVELMLACDHIVASPDSRIGLTQARFGLLPGWGGATRLVERVGRRRAFSLLAQAPVLDASEALTLGMVDQIEDDPLDAALSCRLPTATVRFLGGLRRAVGARERGSERGAASRDDRFAAEHAAFVEAWMDDAHFERVDAFLARNDPTS